MHQPHEREGNLMGHSTAASYGDLVTGGGRNLEELRQEVLRRVERNIMPLGGRILARLAAPSFRALAGREHACQAPCETAGARRIPPVLPSARSGDGSRAHSGNDPNRSATFQFFLMLS
jgi:hypothetical protein